MATRCAALAGSLTHWNIASGRSPAPTAATPAMAMRGPRVGGRAGVANLAAVATRFTVGFGRGFTWDFALVEVCGAACDAVFCADCAAGWAVVVFAGAAVVFSGGALFAESGAGSASTETGR